MQNINRLVILSATVAVVGLVATPRRSALKRRKPAEA